MGEKQVPPQKKKIEDQIPPEDKNNKRNPSLNWNCKVRLTLNKKQIDTRKMSNEPYTEICTFDETDSVTFFTKKNYMIAISFGLTT